VPRHCGRPFPQFPVLALLLRAAPARPPEPALLPRLTVIYRLARLPWAARCTTYR
jgi:hypothetical protein